MEVTKIRATGQNENEFVTISNGLRDTLARAKTLADGKKLGYGPTDSHYNDIPELVP